MKWFLSFLTPFFLFSQSGVEIATRLDQKSAPKDAGEKKGNSPCGNRSP